MIDFLKTFVYLSYVEGGLLRNLDSLLISGFTIGGPQSPGASGHLELEWLECAEGYYSEWEWAGPIQKNHSNVPNVSKRIECMRQVNVGD